MVVFLSTWLLEPTEQYGYHGTHKLVADGCPESRTIHIFFNLALRHEPIIKLKETVSRDLPPIYFSLKADVFSYSVWRLVRGDN